MSQRCQTWTERLNDTNKLTLDAAFIESMMATAARNNKTIDDLWIMWRTYVETCAGHDQSPVFREFVEWHQLIGAGPLS